MTSTISSSVDDSSVYWLKHRIFYVAVLLSGLAGLGYQMVWCQLLAVSLGHEIVAVLAVIAAFFIGLAAGALLLNNVIRRSQVPYYWYVGLELSIGLWALALLYIIPWYNTWIATLIGPTPSEFRHWALAFLASWVLLLPATLAMGATLPALERTASLLWQQQKHVVAIYSINTLGAVVGTLVATFWLIPNVGLNATQVTIALVNICCAVLIVSLFIGRQKANSVANAYTSEPVAFNRKLLGLLFATGCLGIGYEVLVVRVLSQILENTVYSFAALLAVYLMGVSIGAWVYQKRISGQADRLGGWYFWYVRLGLLTAVACLMGIGVLWIANDSYLWILGHIERSMVSAVVTEVVVAIMVFLLPTICMGALFSHLVQRAMMSVGLGKVLGWNTLGCAFAPFLFGIILLPALGAKNALLITVLGYLLSLITVWNEVGSGIKKALTGAVAVLVMLMILPLSLRFVSVSENSRIVDYREGVMAAVAVVEDDAGARHLKVNNHFTMGGTASRLSDHRQTHIPMLLHGNPRSALYLGLGTGITFEASTYYPELTAVGVELIPEAIEVMPSFGVDIQNDQKFSRSQIIAADARRFVLSSNNRFDVIIAEIFHPSRDGAGSLYTQEHFAAIKQRLLPSGVFCQWLPLFQLDLQTLQTIVHTFVSVFDNAQLYLGHYSLQQPILCLAGFNGSPQFEPDWLLHRVTAPKLQQELVQSRLNSDFALFGGYLAGTHALRQWAANAPLNTDNHPVVNYQAPGFVYQQQQLPGNRLLSLLTALAPLREPFWGDKLTTEQVEYAQRFEAYWQARDEFIKTGVAAFDRTNVEQMLAFSRDSLLSIVKQSQDFEPAYRTLLYGAQALAQTNPKAAYDLLGDLAKASPEQREALQLQKRLFGN